MIEADGVRERWREYFGQLLNVRNEKEVVIAILVLASGWMGDADRDYVVEGVLVSSGYLGRCAVLVRRGALVKFSTQSGVLGRYPLPGVYPSS